MGKKITEINKNDKVQVQKCSICYQKIARATILCSHKFCLNCITHWAKKKLSCPLCRQQFNKITYGKKQYHYTLPKQTKKPTTNNNIIPFIIPWRCIIYWQPVYWFQTTQPLVNNYI